MKLLLSIFWAALLLSVAAPGERAHAANERTIIIGSGGVTGVYFPVAGAICRMVNQVRKVHHLRCVVESTDGSVSNLEALKNGDRELGIVQSDVQAAAVDGTLEFKGQAPFRDLRALFSLYPEPLHLMARRDSNIRTLDDLRGKRVNIGNPGSGQRATTKLVLDYLGWSDSDFAEVTDIGSVDQASALCSGKIDAGFFTVGIPSGTLKEATTACDIVIVPIEGKWVDGFIARYPGFAKAVIPGGEYRGNDEDIPTFGPRATVLASSKLDPDVVYDVVKSVFDHLDAFRALHPALRDLTAEQMATQGLTAPLHEGALRYFREAGLRP